MYGYADRYSYIWTAKDVLLKVFLDYEAANLNPPSLMAFPDPVHSSVTETTKLFLTEDTSG